MTQIVLSVDNVAVESLIKDLMPSIVPIVEKEVRQSISKSRGDTDDDQLLTRQQVSKLCGVSLVTVHSWINKGTLKAYKLRGKTYFKRTEVFQSLKQIKP